MLKAVLFCANPYAFGILKPLHDTLVELHHEVVWYIPERIAPKCPFINEVKVFNSIKEVYVYKSDAVFVPGNEVPNYLKGVKVQVFHGLAGEKKGHFRIRGYFDLYLTQGPYFTKRFTELSNHYGNFEVVETGWCKLDPLYRLASTIGNEKTTILQKHGKQKIVLYAPTFSPSLTSAPGAIDHIFNLACKLNIYLMVKFHDLMNSETVETYKTKAKIFDNVEVVEDSNIIKYLSLADLMISDTSSAVYEFLLLDKPVVTICSNAETIQWQNILKPEDLITVVEQELECSQFAAQRKRVIEAYHPYSDGKSSARMVNAVENFIERNGIPDSRKLNLYRRHKIKKLFGPKPQINKP